MFKTEQVEINGELYDCKELSAGQRRKILEKFKADENGSLLQVRLVQAGCGRFSDSSESQIEDLPGTLIDKLSDTITRLSGMGGGDEGKA